MRIIAKRTLREFWQKYPDSENPLKIWFKKISESDFKNFNALRNEYNYVDAVGMIDTHLTLKEISIV